MRYIDEFFKYIRENIPFYKNMACDAALADYPVITKFVVRDKYELLLTEKMLPEDRKKILEILRGDFSKKGESINEIYEYKDYIFEETTGTSGVPFRVVKSKEDRVRIGLVVWRRRKQTDYLSSLSSMHRFNHIGIKDSNMDPYNYDIKHVLDLYQFIEEKGFRWMHISPNPLTVHAKIIQKYGKFRFEKLKFIECTGNFYSEEQRQLFRQIFGAEIINQYGSIETWPLAYSCKNNNMHLLDNIIVELLDDYNNPIKEYGVIGNIVITCLGLKTLPFIRYKIGDYGKFIEPNCSCGVDTPILELIPGREVNIIKGLSDKVFGNIFFAKIIQGTILRLNAWNLIDYIQIWQLSENKFQVNLNYNKNGKYFVEIMEKLSRIELNKNVMLTPVFIDEIEIKERKKEKPNVFLCKY